MNRSSLQRADRLIVALDVLDIDHAISLANQLLPVVAVFKIGYALIFDPALDRLLSILKAADKQVFFDAKLHDIPQTVKNGVRAAASRGMDFITVHSNEALLAAAVEGKADSAIKIMAVTALTSLEASASRDQFRSGVMNAIITGCDGVTMAPHDLTDRIGNAIAREFLGDLLIATPGVRMAGNLKHDHRRTGTPSQALSNGADYIIVGRPIIETTDPRAEAERFIAQMEKAV